MRERFDDASAFGLEIFNRLKLRALTLTLAAAFVIDADAPTLINLDPGGATRTVDLPTPEEGLIFLINNIADAAEDLTIRNAAAATIGTISQNEAGLAICVGGIWYLRLVGTTT